MRRLQIKANGWFPFWPMALPAGLLAWVALVLIDGRPVADTWMRYTGQSIAFAISWWVFASLWVRRKQARGRTG